MSLIMMLYVAVLFVALTPGVLLRLPPKGSLLTVAIVHALVFSLVVYLTSSYVRGLAASISGFENEKCNTDKDCTSGVCANGKCKIIGEGRCRMAGQSCDDRVNFCCSGIKCYQGKCKPT